MEVIAETLTHPIEAVDTTKQVQDHEQRAASSEQRRQTSNTFDGNVDGSRT